MSGPAGGVVVVMGICGTGKSTVGRLLAARTGAVFVEGDDHHPAANRAAMSRGEPLDDADRAPWLATLVAVVAAERAAGHDVVLACSALKRRYRDVLRTIGAPMVFVHLTGSVDLIRSRMAARTEHFMPVSLIDSQSATLEPPEGEPDVLTFDVALDAQVIVDRIVAARGAA